MQKLFEILFDRDKDMQSPPISVQDTERMYIPVMVELLSFPPQPPDMPIRVYWTKEDLELEEPSYLDAVFVNPNYEAPPEGAKMWGGKSDNKNDAPKGYYNCNWENYKEFFGLGLTEWWKMIDSEVEKPDNISWEEALATILYEITFYGWTQEEHDKLKDHLDSIRGEYERAKEDSTLIIGNVEPRPEEITGSD